MGKSAESNPDLVDKKPSSTGRSSPPVQEESKVSFLAYAWGRYSAMSGSIFLDGLVGGMFLAFLMSTEEACADRGFMQVYFIIGMLHFLCGIVENLRDYAEEASAEDGVVSKMEKSLIWLTSVIVHLLRIVEMPMVGVLGYYMIKFSIVERDEWTHDQEAVEPKPTDDDSNSKDCTICYCDANYMHMAEITFFFQVFLGLTLVIMWFVMWYVDSDDDEKEKLEEIQWRKEEERMSKTVYGKVWEAMLLIGMHGFYNPQFASMMLTLSVSLPQSRCQIHVLEWFLIAGVIFTLTGVLNQVQEKVVEMAHLDGIVNKAEHRIIMALKFFKFPLFVTEVVCFAVIVSEVVINFSHITFEEDKKGGEHYCEQGVWTLMLAMTGIYSILFVVRVVVIIAALFGGEKVDEVEMSEQ